MIPVILLVHLLVFFYAEYSIQFRCFIGHRTVTEVKNASVVLVKAIKNCGKDCFAKLVFTGEAPKMVLTLLFTYSFTYAYSLIHRLLLRVKIILIIQYILSIKN